MKKILYIVFLATAAFTFIAAAQLSSKTNRPTESASADLESLKAKVERLERKIDDLQKEIEQLRLQRPLSIISPNPSATPPLLVNPAPKTEIPPSWTPHVFNGQTYYLVPLGQEAQAVANAGK